MRLMISLDSGVPTGHNHGVKIAVMRISTEEKFESNLSKFTIIYTKFVFAEKYLEGAPLCIRTTTAVASVSPNESPLYRKIKCQGVSDEPIENMKKY